MLYSWTSPVVSRISTLSRHDYKPGFLLRTLSEKLILRTLSEKKAKNYSILYYSPGQGRRDGVGDQYCHTPRRTCHQLMQLSTAAPPTNLAAWPVLRHVLSTTTTVKADASATPQILPPHITANTATDLNIDYTDFTD
uniref:Uncharacterized protein n=1 Tax=Romanomermis culicivorax TaxID=13658 RepID=A0A915HZN1_ROMCU